jgi:microcystin-dependent protein
MADKDFKVKNGIDVAGNANISGNLNAAKYQTSAPSSPVTGQIWIDSDASASVINTNDFLLKADFDLQSIPIGGVTQYAGATSPSANWAICDGTAVSRTTYATLFARIGTTYGVGNGTTTFNLPNVKGKVIAGLDSTQTEFDTLGETGGAKTHTLTSAEMPSHTHIQDSHSHNVTWDGVGAAAGGLSVWGLQGNTNNKGTSGTTATNQNTGGGGAHNNLQPYIVMNYLIRMA